MQYRSILYHKHPTSARTRFMLFSHDSVCYPNPLPEGSKAVQPCDPNMLLHPAGVIAEVSRSLGLSTDILKVETDYRMCVDIPGDRLQIVLLSIESVDPPIHTAQQIHADFIDLTQARRLPSEELLLLRSAYELVLGG